MKTNVITASSRQRKRAANGHSLAELGAGLIVGVPLLLAGIDMGFIALGATLNDSVCRDAARAAASGPPAEQTQGVNRKVQPDRSPYQRAVAVIKTHNPTNLPLKVQDKPEVMETVHDVPPAEFGGAVDGELSVKTTVTIVPPFVMRMYLPEGIELASKHLVPYTYVIMPTKKKP